MTAPPNPSNPLLVAFQEDEEDPSLLALAASTARHFGAPLAALLAAAAPRDLALVARSSAISEEQAQTRLAEALESRLAQFCDSHGADVSLTTRLGKPFVEMIKEAQGIGASLLMKRAEELPGALAPLLTSTDQHLLRKCPCPVWLVRGDQHSPPRQIIAAVDLADPDTPEHALNLAIVEAAARVAHPNGCDLRLLHAWQAEGEGLAWLWSSDADGLSRYLRESEAEHAGALRRFENTARSHLATLGFSHVHLRPALRRGPPRKVIAEEVSRQHPDALVLGTLSRAGVPGLLIGNTAEDVLNSVACSIIAVKPPGYESPIH